MPSSLTYTLPTGAVLTVPSPWNGSEPAWQLRHGKTTVFVIDDQQGRLADLGDESALRRKVEKPFNVQFEFGRECQAGQPLARDGKWFEAVAERVTALSGQLAAIVLDIMFEGDPDEFHGAGIAFLGRLASVAPPGLPILISTQADDSQQLQRSLASQGFHLGFRKKDGQPAAEAISQFLFQFGWIADPTFTAYSQASRKMIAELRSYAMRQPRLGNSNLPAPLFIVGNSGEGKSVTATRAVEFLKQVGPWWLKNIDGQMPAPTIPQARIICSEYGGKTQDARIAMFGRGPLQPNERTLPQTGLAVEGICHRTSGGIIFVDEAGNSAKEFQQMLLNYIENGIANPELAPQFTDAQRRRALGPFEAILIFTAQPKQLKSGEVLEDSKRRFERGAILEIPRLAQRPEDILPIFYEAYCKARISREPHWTPPVSMDDAILPAAQQMLIEAVAEHRLSTSRVSDLAGFPTAGMIGKPALEQALAKTLRGKRSRIKPMPVSVVPTAVPPVSPQVAFEREDTFQLIDRLAATPPRFPHVRSELQGQHDRIMNAVTAVVFSYLEAAILAVDDTFNPIKVCNLIYNGPEITDTNSALDEIRPLLLINKTRTKQAIKDSDVIADLALRSCRNNRCVTVSKWLDEIRTDPVQEERLARIDAASSKSQKKSRAETSRLRKTGKK